MIENIEIIKCDCCGTQLHRPQVLRNDGSFQMNFVEEDNSIMCFHCVGVNSYVKNKSTLNVKEMVSETNKILKPLSNQVHIDNLILVNGKLHTQTTIYDFI
jgi:hypothetical protein